MINFRTAKTFLKGVITKKAPMYVQFALSKSCNLKCKMCSAVESRKHENELTLHEIEKLASILSHMGVCMIILTGGEPFLRNDIVSIIKAFSKHHIEVRLQTNGLLISKSKLKTVIDAGVSEVTISLDSLHPETQDFINQREGSWDEIVKTISLFSQMFPIKGNMTGINTVVSKLNLKEIPSIIKFVTDIGFYVSLIPVHILGESSDFIVRKENKQFAFSKEDHEDIEMIYSEIIDMKRKGYHIHNSYRFLKESPDFLKYKRVHWTCTSPDLYFSISPSGKFLPCVDIDTDISMLDLNFLNYYFSAKFMKTIKDKVKECPGCMYACYPEVSFFCRDLKVFIERLIQGFKISQFTRKPRDYGELLKIAEKCKTQNEISIKEKVK